MSIIDEFKKIALEISAGISEEKGSYSFEVLVAERKTFLSRKRLVYSARFQVDEVKKEVRFSEMLKESGLGLSAGGGVGEISGGFGFKKESYNTFSKGREGTIEEQSNLFGKSYGYRFDFANIRKKFEAVSKGNGYIFTYTII